MTRHERSVRMLALLAAILVTLAAAASETAAAPQPHRPSHPPKQLWYELYVTYSGDLVKIQHDTGGPAGTNGEVSNQRFRTSWYLHSTGTNGTDSVLLRRSRHGDLSILNGEVVGVVTRYRQNVVTHFTAPCQMVQAQTTVTGTAKLSGTILPTPSIQHFGLGFSTPAAGHGNQHYSGYTCRGVTVAASDNPYPIRREYVRTFSEPLFSKANGVRIGTRFGKRSFQIVLSQKFSMDFSTTCCLGTLMGSQKIVYSFHRCGGTSPC